MTRAEDITFSVEPVTLRDHILATRVIAQDTEALAELIVRRADPPVTAEAVGEIAMDDLGPVVERLSKSFQTVASLDSIIKSALAR